MAQFPRTEAEIFALAQEMAIGLTANPLVYPSPPVLPPALGSLISGYVSAKNAVTAAEAAVNFDDAKLKLIGWAGRASATPLAAPGQARLFDAPKQGEGWVFLDWKAPTEGGKPAAYKVMRRNRPDGLWQEVATAVITEATLVEQPRGVELEYRAIAVNKAGDGEPSNTAMVVL